MKLSADQHAVGYLPAGLGLVSRLVNRLLPRFSKFIVVGASGILVNMVTLAFLYEVVGAPLLLASVLAVEVAIINNFLWNNRWTFGRTDLSLRRFGRFNLVSLGGLIITTSTLWFLATHAGIYYLLANLVGITLATAWNFSMNVLWTWRRR